MLLCIRLEWSRLRHFRLERGLPAVVVSGTLAAMATAGGESEIHQDLKRRAVLWALAHDFRACGVEVRVPRSGYRADVAAAAVPSGLTGAVGETAVFECKQARADLLRDAADEQATLLRLQAVTSRRVELEKLVGAHLPSLRRGDTLFAECDDFDFSHHRHDGLKAVWREEAQLQAKLFGGTKFDRMRRYRAADRLYLVVAPGVMEPHEAPAGWGVLQAVGADELELQRAPAQLDAGPAARLALLQSIALSGTRACCARLAIAPDTVTLRRSTTMPR